jgi:hypothetical protein
MFFYSIQSKIGNSSPGTAGKVQLVLSYARQTRLRYLLYTQGGTLSFFLLFHASTCLAVDDHDYPTYATPFLKHLTRGGMPNLQDIPES